MASKSISRMDQEKSLPEVRAVRPEFTAIPIAALRGTLRNLDKAFQAFFRRCKRGETPGFPRFRGKNRWNTVTIDDLGQQNPINTVKRRLVVPKFGKVKIGLHRPLEGVPKALRITVDGAGRWWVSIACADVPAKPFPKTGQIVGVDVGLHHFATTSDGETFENPCLLEVARVEMERAQRVVSRRKRGSKRRRKAVQQLARKHEHVKNVRREHHIKVARTLVERYDTVYVEKLNVKGLAKSKLARSVHDAAWSDFNHWLRVKAESAGREVVEVDPRGTSQTCPGCGRVEAKSLAQRVHACPCGCTMDRDVAAAIIIKERGMRSRGGAPGCGTPMIREVRVAG